MDFSLTDDQVMIRDAAQDFLADNSDSEAVRRAMQTPEGFEPRLWAAIGAELGWCAVAVPEEHGGMGMGAVELMLIQEQAGYHLLCSPFFATVCLGTTLLSCLGSDAAQAELLPQVAEGSLRFADSLTDQLTLNASQQDGQWRLSGRISQVCDAGPDSCLLLFAKTEDGLGLFAVPGHTEGVSIHPQNGWDASRRFADVELNQAVAQLRCDAPERLQAGGQKATALARLYIAAEQLGAAQRCLDLTVAYISERKQFGRTIASFQAIKHRCAEMMVQIEGLRSTVYGAAAQAASDAPTQTLATECAMAKAMASDVLFYCAGEAIQLHGGVGFTEEYDPGLYFKRARASKGWLGTPEQLREEIAGVLL
ncbi:MAG: acyl-CoA dehydrogenase family protein [Nevskiales bacterium]